MELIEGNNDRNQVGNRTGNLLGILLIVAGVLLVSDLVGIFPFRFRNIIFSWQMILIVLGVIFINRRESRTTGAVMLIIGIFFLLPRFTILPVNTYQLFWPALLIFIGIMILFNTSSRRRKPGISRSGMNSDAIEDVTVFGGQDRIIETENFRGGEIVNIFGGGNYDLLSSKLAPGKNVLEITMIFGGSKIIVPQDWNVEVDVTAVFGGFSDKRIISSDIGRDPARTLVIEGVAIFGGGELVNVNRG